MKKVKRSFWLFIFAWFFSLALLSNSYLFISFSYRERIMERNALEVWRNTQKNLLQQSLNWLNKEFSLPQEQAEAKIIEWITSGRTELTGHFGLFREEVLLFDSYEEWNVLYHGLNIKKFYPSIQATPDPQWLRFIEGIHSESDGSLVLRWLPVQEEMLLSWTSFFIQDTPYHLVFCTPVQSVYDWNKVDDFHRWRKDSLWMNNCFLLLWIAIMCWVYLWQERKRAQIRKEVDNQQSLLRQYQNELKTVQKKCLSLTQYSSSKDEFLMNMSHELRSPLNTILGMTDALQESALESNRTEEVSKLDIIHESGLHLLSVFNDILDLAKVEARKMVLEPTAFSIKSLCESCLRITQPIATKNNIPIHLDIDPALEGMTADETRLRQVLLNLLNNAVKFGKQGKPLYFEVTQNARQDIIRFTIRNQGEAIPYERASEIFQPFVQLNNTLSRKFQGTGLGLVLALKLVMAHHGSITLTSDEKETAFRIAFPKNPLPAVIVHENSFQILFYTENRYYEEWLRENDIPNCFLTNQVENLRGKELEAYTHILIELPFLLESHLQLIKQVNEQLCRAEQHLIVLLSVWHPRWERELKKVGCETFFIHPFDMNAFLHTITPKKEE